jgi:hypothetical protein
MRSFVSIPLVPGAQSSGHFAVLNIHCQREEMLHGHAKAVAQFVVVIKPLQILLLKLLTAWSALK